MTTEIDRRLEKFMFPVVEKEVMHGNVKGGIPSNTPAYKAIVRKDNNKLISIMKSSYKIVPNSEIIKPLMEQLHRLDTSWYIDNSHSFVDDNQMRLQITFPELLYNDGKSDIALSLFLSNSMDGSCGIKSMWGALRILCSNGMLYGEVLSSYYHKHTRGFDISNLRSQVEATYDKIPVIKHRVQQLQNSKVTKELRQSIENKLGKGVSKYVHQREKEFKKSEDQWVLYNILTYYISHLVKQQLRAKYQQDVSRIFKL